MSRYQPDPAASAVTTIPISPATVKNDWTFARAWLKREVSGRAESDGDRA